MKVLFLTRKWPPAMGGMETYSFNLYKGLRKREDLNVNLISLPGQRDGGSPNLLSLIFFAMTASFRLLFSRNIDVYHVGDLAIWPLALIANLFKPSSKCVISIHGTDISYGIRSTFLGMLYKLYLVVGFKITKADYIANSDYTLKLLKEFGAGRCYRVSLATDFRADIDVDMINLDQLLFVGRIQPGKGLKIFVDNVLENLPDNIILNVAGTIWSDDESAVLDHPRVHYLGNLSADELSYKYWSSLAVVLPYQAPEGFGLVAIEAACCGGIVIASDHSGLRDSCSDGVGILIQKTDFETWQRKILDVSKWPKENRIEYCQNVSNLSREKYSWDRVVEETVGIYYK